MALVAKIDSNITGLRYVEEASLKVLPGSPVWLPLEPNSYVDFGGSISTVARDPIIPSRQRKKGVVSDLDANGGFNTDLTQTNLRDLLQGFLFADIRTKGTYLIEAGAGDLAVTTPAGLPRITATAINFTTLGLVPGEWIYVGGDGAGEAFTTAANNGFKRIRTIEAGFIEIDKSQSPMVAEAGGALTVWLYLGQVLKNESDPTLIKRRTYQLERTLGASDTEEPTQIQSEYLVGAVPGELSFNIPVADKVVADLSFMALDSEQRSGVVGVKAGTRPPIVEAAAFNTSSDFARIKLAIVDSETGSPSPLFAFVTALTVSLNNTLSPNKAIGVLGAFDITAGTFSVGGSMTAYFADVAAVAAVRGNADVTFDIIMAKEGAGIVIDLPLVSLGDGRPNVAKDEPITLPLTMDGATGAKVDADLDHTLMFVFFDALPASAG